MFVAPLPWHRRCASNAMCGYCCVCMRSCTCICVSGSMSVSKRVVSMRLIRYVRYYYNRLWMLSNQRLSSRHSAILSGTQIEFDDCHWVVPALSRSSWVDRRELVVWKPVGCELLIWTQTCGHTRFVACVFAKVVQPFVWLVFNVRVLCSLQGVKTLLRVWMGGRWGPPG